MSFIAILKKLVGDPIKKDDFDKIVDNFDDHESRVGQLETQAAKIVVFDFTVFPPNNSGTVTGLTIYKAIQAFTVNTVEIQIFEKGSVTIGTLEVDVKKNSSPDDVGMTSIMTTLPSIDFSTASDYDTSSGVLTPVVQDIAVDEFLRLDITSIPVGVGKFRVLVYGEV